LSVLLIFLCVAGQLDAATITDDAGQKLDFPAPPARVVSVVPSVTEAICFMGASGSLAGVTYQDTDFEGTAGLPVVGGPLTPRFGIINELDPDLLIVAPRDFERAKAERKDHTYQILVIDDNVSLAESEAHIGAIGKIFDKTSEADAIIRGNREFLETIGMKTERIPKDRRKKAILLTLAPGGIATVGGKSFQAEMIRAAGGITGDFTEEAAEPLTLEKLRDFDPDFIFASHTEHAQIKTFLEGTEWRELRALKDGYLHSFPGPLVNRASAHVGYFVAWLSSEIYSGEFADRSKLVYPEEILSERAISLDVPYVDRARIVESRILDFVHRTLLIDFKRPQMIVSTVDGGHDNILAVGNSYSPTPTWSIYHKLGFDKSQSDLFEVLKLDKNKVDVMLTGADMNNVVIKTASYRDMTATALVTAGVEGNAIRTSKDTGSWYEPGTINVLILTNHRLSEQAATRAIITVTEAKTAALWDMDIRSVQTPLENPATGTGTDTVVIVAGEGVSLDGSGGHTKMGELIADVVYRGVLDALLKQNGKTQRRNVFERLEERGIFIPNMTGFTYSDMEELLLSPTYKECQGFLESAFSLSDAHIMGQLRDLSYFDKSALQIASDIAGRPVERIEEIIPRDDLPIVLKTALDALATGLKYRGEAK
jgi:adenosylcobinamide amidohydrolase/ABC-type Fe3+-hydroxamate transport system substrate-binding protein